MNESENLYETLQVHPTAHPDVITAAYRRLTLIYHPDRNPFEEAAEMMKRLNLAYETLSDPSRRAAYDLTLADRQRQQARTGDTHHEARCPSASRPTTGTSRQTRAGTPNVPSKPARSNDRKIIFGIALIVVIAVLVRFATGGNGATGNNEALGAASSPAGNQFQVSIAPTPTPRATAASHRTRTPTAVSRISSTPTPRQTPASQTTAASAPTRASSAVSGNTATPTPAQTPAPQSTVESAPTRAPSAVSGNTATPTPRPTVSPTPAPTAPSPAREGDYFTRGSSQDDVLHAQGTPREINSYPVLGHETWTYGQLTHVTFSLPDGLVTEWNNYDGNLNVRLLPTTANSNTPGYFTRNSSQDDVLHAQGTPREINSYPVLGHETWTYGQLTHVTFSLPDGLVTEWNNYDGNLNVRLLPTTANSNTPGYFTRNSSQDDVLHAQGTPREINSYPVLGHETWTYGQLTRVTFSLPDGLVTEWNNYDGTLKVR